MTRGTVNTFARFAPFEVNLAIQFLDRLSPCRADADYAAGSVSVDAAIVGGTEAPLTYGILKAWEALRVMAPDTCRPFDWHRKGLVLAEGAGMVVLERADRAKARGAEILAQIAGVGMNADAADLVAPTLE